jgi:hypothetical protein
MPGYEEGHDYHNAPPHTPPLYLSERGRKIYAAIEASLVEQAKYDYHGKGYLAFRHDNGETVIDANISVSGLVKAIEEVLDEKEEADDGSSRTA